MKKPDYRCVYDGKIYSVSSIDIAWQKINLCGADIINFDEGRLLDFTGLKDSIGKKIYNGDIIEFNYQGKQKVICWIEYSEKYAEYITRCNEIYFDHEPLGDIVEYNCTCIKVIGNINIKNDYFDKPEESEANSLKSLDIDISKIAEDAKKLYKELEKMGSNVASDVANIFGRFIDIAWEQQKEIERLKRPKK